MTSIPDAPDTTKRSNNCTEFQLHVKRPTFPNIVDFTEKRLRRCHEVAKDPQQKLLLAALVVDYTTGHVAVAWRRGRPVSVKVTYEA